MTQVRRWNKLSAPGITAIVGAGGKTTVLQKLVEYGLFAGNPMVVTTTTRMLEIQVAQWNPYYGTSFSDAETACSQAVSMCRCGAWFAGLEGKKVESVDPQEIDAMHKLHPDWHIVVEADGAKTKWLKAPKTTEPVIPSLTKTTIGVINLQALGMPIDDKYVHNMDLVTKIVERKEGAVITPSMLAKLITHKKGIFQYSRGKKVLFCTGYDMVPHRQIDGFLEELTETDISQIFLADGYRESSEIRQVLQWR